MEENLTTTPTSTISSEISEPKSETVPTPAVTPTLSENKETETKKESLDTCPPWHENTAVLLSLILLFVLALLFIILYATKKTSPCPKPTCPTNPTKPTNPSNPSNPTQEERPSCPKPESCPSCPSKWEVFKLGLGSTEWGDPGFPVQITNETDTLEKAQEWVRRQKAISLSYPLHPCIQTQCHENPNGVGLFFYTFAPYTRSSSDSRYQSYLFE